MPAADGSGLVTVGRIVRPHGRRGEFVVVAFTDFADERFAPGQSLTAVKNDTLTAVVVTRSRLEHPARNDRWVVAVAGVEGIEAADALRGAELRVEASALKVLGAETYYLHDLEGCRVRTVAGEDLGDVRRVDMTVGTPVLVVEREGREVLVPLAEAICRKVDVRAKRIVVDPPEGLLELNVT